jgi:hypothetical protein
MGEGGGGGIVCDVLVRARKRASVSRDRKM